MMTCEEMEENLSVKNGRRVWKVGNVVYIRDENVSSGQCVISYRRG